MVTVGLLGHGRVFLASLVLLWGSRGASESPVTPTAHCHGQFWLSAPPVPHLPPPSLQPHCPALLCFLLPEASLDSPTNPWRQAHPLGQEERTQKSVRAAAPGSTMSQCPRSPGERASVVPRPGLPPSSMPTRGTGHVTGTGTP